MTNATFSVRTFFPRQEREKANKLQQASRIPVRLQALFLASNRGEAIEMPIQEQSVDQVARLPISESQKAMLGESPTDTPVNPPLKTPSSPQDYLDSILMERGYPKMRYSSLETGYRTQPTDLQIASHGTHLVSLVRSGNNKELGMVMRSGISPNPCNKFGESILHMVCRHGSEPLLSCMLDAGSDVQVSDDYGRTPLHDSCWAPQPSFDAVVLLVNRDRDLLSMMDKRGCTPLDYVRKDNWVKWIDFLDEYKDYWWPEGGANEKYVPPMVEMEALSRQIPDPKNAMPLELARLVASGRMTTTEAHMMMTEEDDDDDETASMSTFGYGDEDFDDDSDFDSEDDSSYDSEDDSSYDSDEDYDSDEEMDESHESRTEDDEEFLRQVERVLNF